MVVVEAVLCVWWLSEPAVLVHCVVSPICLHGNTFSICCATHLINAISIHLPWMLVSALWTLLLLYSFQTEGTLWLQKYRVPKSCEDPQ